MLGMEWAGKYNWGRESGKPQRGRAGVFEQGRVCKAISETRRETLMEEPWETGERRGGLD